MKSARESAYSDDDFTSKRIESRREDAIALQNGQASADVLQNRNSILTKDFWDKSEIDWKALAVGTQSGS